MALTAPNFHYFRDFAARLADSPLLQWFCQVAQLDRVKVPAKSTIQRYSTWLPEEVSAVESKPASDSRIKTSHYFSFRPVGDVLVGE
jgi:hypothetical protein